MSISTQKTIIILKHDAVARGLMGEILKRFERAGLKMTAFKFIQAPENLAIEHYPSDEAWYRTAGERTLTEYKEKGIDPVKELGTADAVKIGKLIKKWNVDYLTEGPILATVWEGYDVIKVARKLVGSTKPAEAVPGTIRGDFSIDNVELANALKRPFRNLVHASGNESEAKNELDLWFEASEICSDYFRADQEMMFKTGV